MNKRLIIWIWIILKINTLYSQGFEEGLKRAKQLSDSLKYDQAILHLQDLLVKAEESKNDTITIDVLIKLGSAYLDVEKNEIGINYYRRGLQIAKTNNREDKAATAFYGLGAAFQQMEQYDSSYYYYRKAIGFYKKSKSQITLSYLFSNLSLLFFHTNQLDSMEHYSKAALDIQTKIGDKYGSGASYSNLGLIAREKRDYASAIQYYRKSISDYAEMNFTKGYSESLRYLAITFYMLNHSDSAARYFYMYDSIGHDILHEDYQDKILELETKFKTAEVERDNAIKQAEIEENKRQLLILYTFTFFLITTSILSYILFNQRRKRLKLASEKNIQNLLVEQEMKATNALLEGQDKERKRIAAELHDNLGSILVTLNMYADALQTKQPKEMPAIANKIAEVAQLANEESRKISHSLDSGMLKHFGLEAAINQLTEAVATARNISFNLSMHTDRISSDAALEVYRIIQELVNNTLKHAHCNRVNLELTQVGKALTLIYEDNGVGFNRAEIKSGIGLKNIENRVQKLDGELTVDSSKGKGSTFIIEIQDL
ncbi:sensor histidine kinase [Ekhidna sp. MALMAid0563]|uniref:tetratricopeptide repeat-containing sensor histidine kinase n=1 Tax=Ekhidna sp. MALMAid0563 TaxID=3143937 RepID=UPI0032DFE38A